MSKASETATSNSINSGKYPESIADAKNHQYCFWSNKPVLDFNETVGTSEPFEELIERQVYSSDNPVSLPSVLEWSEIDMTSDSDMKNVVSFLREHYLVDVSNKFKLDYTPDFIRWALGSKGFMIALVSKNNKNICGVVGASIKSMTVFDKTKQSIASVDFLCAHPKYRKRKVAFVLIDEIVRRIVRGGCNVGCFTTNRCVPSPTTVIRYYHRPLHYTKLFDLGFTRLQDSKQTTINKFEKLFNVVAVNDPSYVLMKREDVQQVLKIYYEWMARFNIYTDYDEESFAEYFLGHDFIKTYCILDKDKNIVDFVSMYLLPYCIDNNPEKINAGYLLTYTATKESTNQIIKNVLKIASNFNLDVFNVTDIMTIGESILTRERENDEDSDTEEKNKMYEHKFIRGSGKIYFNFFNWKCPRVKPQQINWVTP